VLDVCGVCGGNGSSCSGCDNPDSGRVRDDCGVCNGKGGCVPYTLASPIKPPICSLNAFTLTFTASFPRDRTRIAILNSSSAKPSYVAAIDIPASPTKGEVTFDSPWSPPDSITIVDPWSSALLPRHLPAGSYIAQIFVMSSLTSVASNFTSFKVRNVDVCGVCGGDGSSCAKTPSVLEEILSQFATRSFSFRLALLMRITGILLASWWVLDSPGFLALPSSVSSYTKLFGIASVSAPSIACNPTTSFENPAQVFIFCFLTFSTVPC
jgi:hypothetical protein